MDPSGFAEVFLSAWLRSAAGADSAQASLVRTLAPDVELPEPDAESAQALERVTALSSTKQAKGAWSVTAAAGFKDGSVRYFTVPLASGGRPAQPSYAVTSGPAEVSAPDTAKVPDSRYEASVPGDGPVASTVQEFFSAYLAGAGAVDRYAAPGVRIRPVRPAPYSAVEVGQVTATDESAAGAVPGDGRTVGVQVTVEARRGEGVWPLVYRLSLTARSGRWDVAAVDATAAGAGGVR
ncbi:conjugal transfer protein [Streptomyces sp. 8N706]|uniref:conjugal transfer protein n=1 Tax=Streptomyces sp. 8N706 TaxID=3457416 RepID=UPI003FD43A35